MGIRRYGIGWVEGEEFEIIFRSPIYILGGDHFSDDDHIFFIV